jgi:hypothetical protein
VTGDLLARSFRALLAPVLLLSISTGIKADGVVPSPEDVLGFRPGDDSHLTSWVPIVEYFKQVDAASDRVVMKELGRTTENNPYIVAIVSSKENIAKLDRYRDLQRRVADPRLPAMGDDPVRESKPVVLITCSIHSNETASTLMAAELLHDLATKDDEATKEVLDNTIVLIVPSANPDGIDKVYTWYEQSKGHPWEGEGMPWLYHKYAGHDTNRDWFMLNLKETQLLTRFLYHEWFPTITYDVHQMGSKGARLFVPPFYDPINPNLDPRVSQGIFLIGSHMAADLAAVGKKGVLTNAMYDNWWNGGNRTTPQRHNMVGVLTEAASVKLATPIYLDAKDLGGATRGFANHRQAVNFVDPWPGGWWRLRDIVDYELIAARSVLRLAARFRVQFQSNYQAMARDAIERGRNEPPFGWIVPSDQRDPATAGRMVGILRETGIDVRLAKAPFEADGVTYPAGSWILNASQPYRAHLKDMMERQVYPARFAADGSAETPYDVAGWTLPLQMGVRSVEVARPFGAETDYLDHVTPPAGVIDGPTDPVEYVFALKSNDDYIVYNRLVNGGFQLNQLDRNIPVNNISGHRLQPEIVAAIDGWFVVAASPEVRETIATSLRRATTRVAARKEPAPDVMGRREIVPRRLGLYQPWVPSMDEGWTRLVLERFGFAYSTLHNADIRAGGLRSRFDVILIPSITPSVLREGFAKDATEPRYTGGLGVDGSAAIREFLQAGGCVIGLEDSCNYLIQELRLPATNALAGLKTSEFYGPGSILRAELVDYRVSDQITSPSNLLSIPHGLPPEVSVYFDRSLAFDVPNDSKDVQVFARYAKTDPLESGWLLGAEKIRGKAAALSVKFGSGRVVLFGFPPQHRGQTHGTFRLLFNAILRG